MKIFSTGVVFHNILRTNNINDNNYYTVFKNIVKRPFDQN